MIPFDLWGEAFVFGVIYTILIIVPCVLITLLGKKMIHQLGHYPSKAPIIQMSIFIPLLIIEIITFVALLGFYQFFIR